MGQPQTPQPLPQTFSVSGQRGPNGPVITLAFQGVCGQWVTFLDASSAADLAGQISDTVAKLSGGLIVPRAGIT